MRKLNKRVSLSTISFGCWSWTASKTTENKYFVKMLHDDQCHDQGHVQDHDQGHDQGHDYDQGHDEGHDQGRARFQARTPPDHHHDLDHDLDHDHDIDHDLDHDEAVLQSIFVQWFWKLFMASSQSQ